MANAAHLEFRLSGGAGNVTPSASLGGAVSSTVILSQTITASSHTGITYDDACGNPVGSTGDMYLDSATPYLKWKSPVASNYGPNVTVASNGKYTVYDASGLGMVKVTRSGAVGVTGNQSNISIGGQTLKLFDDVLRVEAADGDVEYRCFYVKNNHASDAMTAVSLWLSAAPYAAETITLGLDPAGKNGTATAVADEHTAPTGVTFSAYTSAMAPLSVGSLSSGDYYAVWIKRVVTPTNARASSDGLTLGAFFQ